MDLKHLITAFSALGKLISSLSDDEIYRLSRKSGNYNNWFTELNVRLALERIKNFLQEDRLNLWLEGYQLPVQNRDPKKVGLVLPGNFPAAGFPDFLAVLISGNKAFIKLNAQDPVLIPFLAEELCQIEPAFRDKIFFEDVLKGMDAIIATETGNSSRYLKQYLQKLPHVIRKNRKSIAVLTGTESKDELKLLGKDITQYYGLDNRSVSKIFVPEGYNFNPLFEELESFSYLKDHHKFVNNYDFNKSLYLVNLVPHLDNGFLLFKEDKSIVSPISVLFYQTYQYLGEVEAFLKGEHEIIESVVGHSPISSVPFGKANKPELWDYANNIDTLAFLQSL